MKTYIYILVDPITNQIRYIGKSNNPFQRFKNHKNRCRDKNTHKRNWINKLRLKGVNPEIEVIDMVDIKDWKYWEKFWIQYFKSIGCNLTNNCDGGEGLTFANRTSFKKGRIPWNKGNKHSIATLEKIKEKRKMQINHKFSSVERYTKDGKYIDCFKLITEASKTLNISAGHISSVCKGKRKSAGGFLWKYK